jgi:hypothetical protein
LSTSISYNVTSFAATNLKGTNLPAPAQPYTPPPVQHKTLPHALARASNTAAKSLGPIDRLGKALGIYGDVWAKIGEERVKQDKSIEAKFLAGWQQTLNTSIQVAMKARQAVKVSRLELDAAKQSSVFSGVSSLKY